MTLSAPSGKGRNTNLSVVNPAAMAFVLVVPVAWMFCGGDNSTGPSTSSPTSPSPPPQECFYPPSSANFCERNAHVAAQETLTQKSHNCNALVNTVCTSENISPERRRELCSRKNFKGKDAAAFAKGFCTLKYLSANTTREICSIENLGEDHVLKEIVAKFTPSLYEAVFGVEGLGKFHVEIVKVFWKHFSKTGLNALLAGLKQFDHLYDTNKLMEEAEKRTADRSKELAKARQLYQYALSNKTGAETELKTSIEIAHQAAMQGFATLESNCDAALRNPKSRACIELVEAQKRNDFWQREAKNDAHKPRYSTTTFFVTKPVAIAAAIAAVLLSFLVYGGVLSARRSRNAAQLEKQTTLLDCGERDAVGETMLATTLSHAAALSVAASVRQKPAVVGSDVHSMHFFWDVIHILFFALWDIHAEAQHNQQCLSNENGIKLIEAVNYAFDKLSALVDITSKLTLNTVKENLWSNKNAFRLRKKRNGEAGPWACFGFGSLKYKSFPDMLNADVEPQILEILDTALNAMHIRDICASRSSWILAPTPLSPRMISALLAAKTSVNALSRELGGNVEDAGTVDETLYGVTTAVQAIGVYVNWANTRCAHSLLDEATTNLRNAMLQRLAQGHAEVEPKADDPPAEQNRGFVQNLVNEMKSEWLIYAVFGVGFVWHAPPESVLCVIPMIVLYFIKDLSNLSVWLWESASWWISQKQDQVNRALSTGMASDKHDTVRATDLWHSGRARSNDGRWELLVQYIFPYVKIFSEAVTIMNTRKIEAASALANAEAQAANRTTASMALTWAHTRGM